MATVDHVKSEDEGFTQRHTWSSLDQNATGNSSKVPGGADKSVQVTGDFGGGSTVVIEGSLEAVPTNWVTLTDYQGNDLSFTSSGLKPVADAVIHIRPRVTSGDGSTDLVVTVVYRRTK